MKANRTVWDSWRALPSVPITGSDNVTVNAKGPFVYVLLAETVMRVKVGTTGDVKSRLSSIRNGSPVPLRLVGLHTGGYDLERHLHAKFNKYRLHGEWFYAHSDLLSLCTVNISPRTPKEQAEIETRQKEVLRLFEKVDLRALAMKVDT